MLNSSSIALLEAGRPGIDKHVVKTGHRRSYGGAARRNATSTGMSSVLVYKTNNVAHLAYLAKIREQNRVVLNRNVCQYRTVDRQTGARSNGLPPHDRSISLAKRFP